jgi:hypothetical protein
MSTADNYAKWIVENEDKRGTPDFETVVKAYEEAKAQETAMPPAGVPAAPNSLTTVEPSLTQPATNIAAAAAVKPAVNIAASQGADLLKLAKIAGEVTPSVIGQFLGSPIKYGKELMQAYAAGHPMAGQVANMPLKSMPGAAARAVGGALMAPENILTAPYQMAAYEQAKIRANPTAPEYATNPYAQMTRGEAATQGQAGAMNRRNALINQQYGGLTPEQQQMLQQDQMRQQEIQKKKIRAQQVLQQPPTAQNFIERMVAMGDLYGTVNQG